MDAQATEPLRLLAFVRPELDAGPVTDPPFLLKYDGETTMTPEQAARLRALVIEVATEKFGAEDAAKIARLHDAVQKLSAQHGPGGIPTHPRSEEEIQ